MRQEVWQLNQKSQHRHRSLTAVLAWVLMAGMLLPLVEAAFPPQAGCAMDCCTASGNCCCTGVDEDALPGRLEIRAVRFSSSCPADCALPPSGSSVSGHSSAVVNWSPFELPQSLIPAKAGHLRLDRWRLLLSLTPRAPPILS